MKPYLLSILILAESTSMASTRLLLDFDQGVARGIKTTLHTFDEVCIVPKHLSTELGFDRGSTPFEKQEYLCGLEFYKDPEIGICPKGESTNPGVEIFELKEGVVKEEFESKHCIENQKNYAKKTAKLKSSITCSYAPSILAYGQFSEYFEGGDAPKSVLRTMNKTSHLKIIEQGTQTRIADMWKMFYSRYEAPKSNLQIFTNDLNFIYGALIGNSEGSFYSEFYGPKHAYEEGLAAFKQTKTYVNITNAKAIEEFLPKTLNDSAQTIQAMKDMSDMILLDTMLSQQDRFGNVDYREFTVWVENGKVISESTKKTPLDSKPQAVLVKKLAMNDNDCGVRKENKFKDAKVLEEVKHFHPRTFEKLKVLAKKIDEPVIKNYFIKDLLFTESDFKKVRKNILDAHKILKDGCVSGEIIFDLDIEEHLGLKEKTSANCE